MQEEFTPGDNDLAVTFRYDTREVEVWECGGEMDAKGEIEVIRYHPGMPDLEVVCLSQRDDGTWRLGDDEDSVVEFVSIGSTEPHKFAAARAMARQAYGSLNATLGSATASAAWCAAFRAAMTALGHEHGMRAMDSTLEDFMTSQGVATVAAKLAEEFWGEGSA